MSKPDRSELHHAVRSPLATIEGFTRLLEESPDIEDGDRAFLRKILLHTDHLAKLFADLIELDDEGRPDHPAPLAMEAASFHRILAQRDSRLAAKLRFHLHEGIPEKIRIDELKFSRAFDRLVTSLVSVAGIEAPEIGLELRSDAETLVFELSLPEHAPSVARLEELLAPGYRALKLGPEAPGTRLGVRFAERLSNRYGGRLFVVGGDGEAGALHWTFALQDLAPSYASNVTKAESVRLAAGRARAEALPLDGCSALVVDDASDFSDLLELWFQRAGAKTERVQDGRAAVAAVAQEASAFDLIVMDLKMPRLSGDVAAKLIRELGYDRPILVVTGCDGRAERERALRSGADEVLVKPIAGPEFLACIERLLSESGRSRRGSVVTPALPDELIRRYRLRLRQTAEEIREAYENSDGVVLTRLAHRLKGTGQAYGFPEVSERAGALEGALSSDRPDPVLIRGCVDGLLEVLG